MAREPLVPGVLLTGHPSAGKTTLARALVGSLTADGIAAETLDGDELRERLPPRLGFTAADRAAQLRRAVFLAELLAAHRVVPVLALVAPLAQERRAARARFGAAGWLEVRLDPPREVCVARDSNGVYAALAARGGRDLLDAEVFGVYEPGAQDPVLRIDTAVTPVDAAVAEVRAALTPLLARAAA